MKDKAFFAEYRLPQPLVISTEYFYYCLHALLIKNWKHLNKGGPRQKSLWELHLTLYPIVK